MNENDVVIVSAVRTPFGKFDGVLRGTDSIDLGVMVLKEVIGRIDLDPGEVDEVYYGTCIPAEYAIYTNVPARQITLLAGFPEDTISLTIDRACCSSMTALRLGYRAIKAGDADVVIACGAENMGNVPFIASAAKTRWGNRLGPIELEDILFELGYGRKGFAPVAAMPDMSPLSTGFQGRCRTSGPAGSHVRCLSAYEAGKLRIGEEILRVVIPQKKGDPIVMDRDESPRAKRRARKNGRVENRVRQSHCNAGQCSGLEFRGVGHRDHEARQGRKPWDQSAVHY